MAEIKDSRLPLAEVVFVSPTKIPGITMMMTSLEAGVRRVVDGKDWLPPPLWVNLATRTVHIEDYTYPFERVHCYRRANAAITKVPPPLDLTKYTVGKR